MRLHMNYLKLHYQYCLLSNIQLLSFQFYKSQLNFMYYIQIKIWRYNPLHQN